MEVKWRILIVDDEQINLDFFDVMLTKLGFEVDKASDGEEALERVKKNKPDLIILDNIMPKLSGWEVTKILKQNDDFEEYRYIPIIMFSALDDVKDKIEGFELGIEDYITKPFNFSEVLARIKAVLRHQELSSQVMNRERRMVFIESLNKSLVYFTQHLKQPVLDLINAAKVLKKDERSSIDAFVALVLNESEETMAALAGLEEEISDLQSEGNKLKAQEVSLEALEEKYQKHFNSWKKQNESVSGVEN